jgi:carbamate kinase
MLNMEKACKQLVPLVQSGNRVVITHGNGPQVGNLLIQQEESAANVPQQPLDICVGMTQGQIGTMLQQVLDKILRNERVQRDVVTLVSHFVVAEDDPDFDQASKPIGPFFDEGQKRNMKTEAIRSWRSNRGTIDHIGDRFHSRCHFAFWSDVPYAP